MSRRFDTKKWAEFYGVTQRSVQIWLSDNQPIEHPEAMAKVILANKRSSAPSRARAAEILSRVSPLAEGSPPRQAQNSDGPSRPSSARTPGAPIIDPDWQAFVDGGADAVASVDIMSHMKALRSFNAKKLEAAHKVNAFADIKFYGDQVLKYDTAINQNMLMAKKLGLDAGELLPRVTVERFVEAFVFLLMRGVDDELSAICADVAGLTFPEEVRPLMESFLLSTRILRPFRGVIDQKSGLGLPPWLVDKIMSAASEHIELTPPPDPVFEPADASLNSAVL